MIESEEDRRTLQQGLDTLQRCEEQWLMQLHPDKWSTDHNKNSTTVQVYNPRTGTKQRQLRQVPGFEHP
jgi:hypothetical protein